MRRYAHSRIQESELSYHSLPVRLSDLLEIGYYRIEVGIFFLEPCAGKSRPINTRITERALKEGVTRP
jgi:hypothetical protein